MTARALPRTPRGARTRARLLEAAEDVFATVGYHEASIVRITEQAGVALGTFYVHFPGKKEIFDEVVLDLSRRVRQAMTEGASGAADRIEAERLGFEAFFRFTAEQPALYRIIRQAEFVSPETMRAHYDAICAGVRRRSQPRPGGRGDP
ncbi:TetR/AcrR family transcriptional regulator [Ornithinimicrobium flavum]|uniref:TetR/AcrR family transcriptional regulator n=1 Tax=Ornithinimicrobium flavum TaxID=1288636 RepID=UPI001EE8FF7E|nr:TetR/AcrR family transcriptional regulator [Ornithinimicrobium flavum]